MKVIAALAVAHLGMAAMTTHVMAAGDAAAGKAKSATCAACHGAKGMSAIPGYPHLAGQDATYLASALKAYKSGERKGGQSMIMAPMAAGLSDQDMMDLAAYYNSLGK